MKLQLVLCVNLSVAGHESREAEVDATCELTVTESETQEVAVGAMPELVAGGKTHEAAVDE